MIREVAGAILRIEGAKMAYAVAGQFDVVALGNSQEWKISEKSSFKNQKRMET